MWIWSCYDRVDDSVAKVTSSVELWKGLGLDVTGHSGTSTVHKMLNSPKELYPGIFNEACGLCWRDLSPYSEW